MTRDFSSVKTLPTIFIVLTGGLHGRTKHLQIRAHYSIDHLNDRYADTLPSFQLLSLPHARDLQVLAPDGERCPQLSRRHSHSQRPPRAQNSMRSLAWSVTWPWPSSFGRGIKAGKTGMRGLALGSELDGCWGELSLAMRVAGSGLVVLFY